ncbi:MAG: hypothetical protein PHX47_01190 [Candidatus ainarchaeum sp.]|jgi:hypothetical protein|nr:hypothetical protein [Candidatus ainarchaeum sp.]NCP71913.1 hypothetical protein [archaeon]NCP79088.1 hypothetical protein [archaeon]NCP97530.1 hypothetical protein [archaeon]NCQ06855.1 hypothetical protein [archaeon]
MNNIIYLSAFQHVVWIVLLIVISMVIYSWTKSKVANNTFSVIITIVIVYLLFVQYPDFVWFAVIGALLFSVSKPDIKKLLKDFRI